MNPATAQSSETAITLPTGLLIGTVLGTAVLTSAGWLVITRLGGWTVEIQVSGIAGGAVAGFAGILGTLIMKPWKSRPISWWMTMWLAGTVVRLFLTPALTFVLYSAVSLNAMALTLSVALTYLLVVVVEAFVLAGYVGQTLYPRSENRTPLPSSSTAKDT